MGLSHLILKMYFENIIWMVIQYSVNKNLLYPWIFSFFLVIFYGENKVGLHAELFLKLRYCSKRELVFLEGSQLGFH